MPRLPLIVIPEQYAFELQQAVCVTQVHPGVHITKPVVGDQGVVIHRARGESTGLAVYFVEYTRNNSREKFVDTFRFDELRSIQDGDAAGAQDTARD